jgi:hypothetical protein
MVVRIALAVLAWWSAALALSAQDNLAGRKVALAIVNSQDLSSAHWAGANPHLVSVRTVVKNDETIYTLLQKNGILPDSEAFTLVYDLNPELHEVRDLQDGASLNLPRVAPETDLRKLADSGDLARISVDPDLRNGLSESIKELQVLVSSSGNVASSQTRTELTDLAGWYAQIDRSYRRRTGPPLRRETLLELSDEAAALNALLQGAVQAKRPLSSDDEAQVGAIYDDLTKVMLNYGQVMGNQAPKGEDTCDVVVDIKGADTNGSMVLRVYYTFNGLYRNPPSDPPVKNSEWAQLGSGHKGKLLNDKTYELWAARDGDPGHPLTAPVKLKTTCESSPTAVELSVVSGAR